MRVRSVVIPVGIVALAALAIMSIPGANAAPGSVNIYQEGQQVVAGAMSDGGSIQDFYGYSTTYGASSDMGFEVANESRLFIWSGPEGTSMVINHNIAAMAPGPKGEGGSVGFAYVGLPSNGRWIVQDDQREFGGRLDRYSDDESYNVWTDCCTDGGAFNDLGDTFCVTVTPTEWGRVDPRTGLPNPFQRAIDTWSFLYGDPAAPVRIDLDMNEPVVIEGNNGCYATMEGRAASVYGRFRGVEVAAAQDTGSIRSADSLYEERFLAKAVFEYGKATTAHAIVEIGGNSVRSAGAHPVPDAGGDQVYAGSEVEEVILRLPGLGEIEIRGVYADAYASCTEQRGITRVREVLVGGVPVHVSAGVGEVTGHNTRIGLGPYEMWINREKPIPGGFESAGVMITGNGNEILVGYAKAVVHGCDGGSTLYAAPVEPWLEPLAPMRADLRVRQLT